MPDTPYRWLHARFWPALVGYWLVCTVGAGAIARAGGGAGAESGWIILLMLVLVSICMGTERGDWQIRKRVGFVPLVWLLHAVLSLPAGILVVGIVSPELLDRALTFVASLPIAIFAMRRSWLFVAPTEEAERDDSVLTQ
jgi:hypothetical protein